MQQQKPKAQSLVTVLTLWLPLIVWMSIIFTFSSFSTLPGSSISGFDFVLKKGAHMFMFGMLYLWWWRVLSHHKINKQYIYILAFLLTLIYACSDEWHQSFTPGRSPSIVDVGFDSVGAMAMYLKLRGLV